ncbi:MAG TPA: hypothetical protein VN882_01090 [Steroidobacteraceae bacterium]|jgi:hypothetical protein|nr:hypothetical protein [Steroidobacteraceae bacterium]
MADTVRLKRLEQPTHVERLLEAFISRAGILPADAYRIRHPDAIPAPLRGQMLNAVTQGRAWICRACGPRMWLLTAKMSLTMSRARGATVLQVEVYGEHGHLEEVGSWMPDYDGGWQLCAD